MTKAEFLNLIETELQIRLTTYQLDYFFNSNIYRVVSTPRQAGKDFIAAIDLLYACISKPGTRTLYCCTTKTQKEVFMNTVNDIMSVLSNTLRIEAINISLFSGIEFNNTSYIRFIDCDKSIAFRGQRVSKVIIMEPDTINPNEYEEVLLTAASLGPHCDDFQLSVIGTHSYMKPNLLSCILNPYYYKIQAKREDLPRQMTQQQLSDLRKAMPNNLYNLEINNIITPSMLNSMFSVLN